ncbi:MAG: LysR family transcriptional regulator [Pseudomonadota bacterium]
MDRFDTIEAFLSVAQEGSFTAAGRRLGVSTKRVSAAVAELEERLSVRLFNRTTRSVALTEAGTACLERCQSLLEQMEALEAQAREQQTALSGPLRITAPTGFGSKRLTAALVPFLAAHPAVALDLRLSDLRLDLVEEGLDLAIRVGAPRDSSLIQRKLAEMPLLLCAAPSYLDRHGRPQRPAELTGHTCILNSNQGEASVWRFWPQEGAGEEERVTVTGTLSANAPAATAQLAIGGLGITRCPRYAVEDFLRQGLLERVLTDYRSEDFGLYALYPPGRHMPARLRALLDHLARFFA